MRIGIGYDAHRLIEGRRLILGGVEIEYEKGLLGHSDADVLTHAVIDAALGAAGLRDIGTHFPDSDAKYKDICSIRLLEKTAELIRSAGYAVSNIDAVITAQRPKLSPYLDAMRENIAKAVGVPADGVNVKATTTEGMGFEGRGEGISAQAACLLKEV